MIKKVFNKFINKWNRDLSNIESNIYNNNLLIGKLISNQNQSKQFTNIAATEFKVFSQWGDDGIIQFLVSNLNLSESKKRFVEFGVENYKESNTRFLLENNNWEGLIIDGSKENIDFIKSDPIYWKHSLTAINSFITQENINEILVSNGFEGEIGILHIDIDGNDYWVWKAINVIDPIIAIIEYNSIFGKDRSITIPYQENFVRHDAHYSNIYAGSSLPSLLQLAKEKGYVFIGCNSAGNNAYFIREAYIPNISIKPVSLEEGFVRSKFREARNESGELLFASHEEASKIIKGLPVFNTINKQIEEY
ncbi:MAG: hypothetical protein R2753_17795 [Chitinophagales bacterium]